MSSGQARASFHVSRFARHIAAFTLIELLTVISIIAIIAALLAPTLHHFAKGDRTITATRQMLDDVARARQLAIANHTTVYMVFVPTNFWATWGSPPAPSYNSTAAWTLLQSQAPSIARSSVVTQLYGAQLTGYTFVTLRSLGDQPGQWTDPKRWQPRYLSPWKTLPEGSFIAQVKFVAPQYNSSYSPPPFWIQTNEPPLPSPLSPPALPIWGFAVTNRFPFPIADVSTNYNSISTYVWLPYIAFNYLGQLSDFDGNVLNHDEYIPLAQGSVVTADPATKMPKQGPADVMESPSGNSTNTYNVVHIDALTGRARLEHQEVQ